MEIRWEPGAEVRVRVVGGTVVISANKEGLLSLSGQLSALAGAGAGSHIHYDEYNSLEEGSAEMVVEKAAARDR